MTRYKAKNNPFATISCGSCDDPFDSPLPTSDYGNWDGCGTCPNCGALYVHRDTPDESTIIPIVGNKPDESKTKTYPRVEYPK